MEIARLETMKRHQEREQSLRKELVNARKHIEVQMEEHKVQMEAEREAVRREQEELKEQMKEQARVCDACGLAVAVFVLTSLCRLLK